MVFVSLLLLKNTCGQNLRTLVGKLENFF